MSKLPDVLETPWSVEWSEPLSAFVIKDRDGVVFAELVRSHGTAGRANLECRARMMVAAPTMFSTLRAIAGTPELHKSARSTQRERVLRLVADETIAELRRAVSDLLGDGEARS